jgi:hypothetical protein
MPLAFILLFGTAISVTADDRHHHCARCGCVAVTTKICRPVVEIEKKSKTVYEVESEEFCVPGPSTRCGRDCTCHACRLHGATYGWQPGCGTVRTRCILKKSSVEEEVPNYRWEIVDLCAACAGSNPATSAAPSATNAGLAIPPVGNYFQPAATTVPQGKAP